MNSFLLLKTDKVEYRLYTVRTNEKPGLIEKKILSDLSTDKRIIFQGLYRTDETKEKINFYSTKELLLPFNTDYIFIVSETEKKEFLKPKTKFMTNKTIIERRPWKQEELSLLFEGTVEEVAVALNRTVKAVSKMRSKLKQTNPNLYDKLISKLLVKEKPIKKSGYKWFSEEDDKIIIQFENNLKVAAELLKRDLQSVTVRRYKIRSGRVPNKSQNYYESLKMGRNLKSSQEVKTELERRKENKSISNNTPAIISVPSTHSDIKNFNFLDSLHSEYKLLSRKLKAISQMILAYGGELPKI